MYRQMADQVGLPQGVGEGWAHYAGSLVISEVAAKLGEGIWPQPYDVSDVEGIGRLKRQSEEAAETPWDKMDADRRAGLVFCRLEKGHGRERVMAAMAQALGTRPGGKELMPRFLEALRAGTGDPKAGEWIPESVLVPQVAWQVAERNPGDAFLAGQRAEKDEAGTLLAYDDGTMESKRSTAGSGHAVLFRAPEGKWQLDGVRVFGARYGAPEAPKEDFSLYVCDADFNVLHTLRIPYALFERGAERWVGLRFDPVEVPALFHVCLYFAPTAMKGVFVGMDQGVERSHSRHALPYSHVTDVREKADWMIRAHLRPAP